MSHLDKLSILGIRSFDNSRSETIQFHSPLTLIVGYNGSGKTTIIECLKYATTGGLPPGNKASPAGFIHDPKLAGEKEVLAQIKISFRSTEGVKMVATRSMQLTVKKASQSFKALEGNLLMLRDGDKFSISSRVGEMSELVPRYLGVSKAILENVIFCHQEDSLWPLSGPTELKNKFDAIFEALKYTKAIENIKVLRKTKRDDLKVLEANLANSKKEKAIAEEMEKQAAKLNDEIQSCMADIKTINAEIEDVWDKENEAFDKRNDAGKIVGELRGKRIERDSKEESVKSLRENLTEMEDSDADLQKNLEQFESRVQSLEDDVNAQKDQYSALSNEIKETQDRISVNTRECGSLEAQKESYDRQVVSREQLIKETARAHNIRGFDLEIDESHVRAFLERITKMFREQTAAFERARRENQDELKKVQQTITEINEKKSGLTSRKETSRQAIAEYDRKIANLQSSLGKINVDEGEKVAMESNLQETQARLIKAKAELNATISEQQSTNADAEIRKLEDRKDQLDSELDLVTRQAGDSAQLDYVQKELKDRQRSLATMVGAHGDKIHSIIGQDWTPSTIESSFEKVVAEKQSEIAEAEKQRDGISRELQQLDYKLNTCRSDLKGKQQTLKDAADKIREVLDCEPQDYPEEVKQLEEDRDMHKSDTDSFSRVTEYFTACEKIAKEHKRCKTCMRSLDGKKEIDMLLASLAEERKKFTFGSDVKQELKELESALSDAKAISTDFDTWERLKEKEVPALVEEDRVFSDKREKLVSNLEDQDSTVRDLQSAKRDVDAINRTIQTIAKYQKEISEFENQIKELLAKQEAAGLSRGLEIVREEIKQVSSQYKEARALQAKMVNDRDRSMKSVNSLELQVRDIQGKVNTAEYQLKEKASLNGQIDELRASNNQQRENIRSLEKDLQELAPLLSQAQVKYDDISRRGAEKDRELQDEANKLSSSLNKLKLADREIQSYIERGGPDQLKRGKREAERLQEELAKLEQERSLVARQVNKLQDDLRNLSERKRNISDNQRFRRDLRALQKVRSEIEQLEQHNAEDDWAHWEAEGHRFTNERNHLAARKATVSGEMKGKDEELKRNMDNYQTSYANSARKYKEYHIELEATKACVEDLGRYSNALDQAIMKYHSLKMEEINRIIDELWRKTYQGTDIDTVLIRSENDTGRTNKNYNYRVCMVKNEVEMDMRGRCSAGQKVLACIIIRLALAECFGTNCGLIALDEPTTNLDQDNIRALAESLAEIIKFRKAQKNFQLIVITHDEEFLRAMNCSDHAEVYYRVGRNDRQKSEIQRQNIAEVM
ncbi:DNA repair protein Rad50 [Acrodontium crateriforme]|uniref:DNA repair protein RAD50 n=1 Tax=Acrodontium crateriforme TaxID=150365 RepID=A0AAQ3M5Q0_9PEZI|nr:DNA repair protein Rad50 [Acrodontium crateriforme]